MTAMELNLDSMPHDELMDFWMKTNRARPVSFARQLFPSQPSGYVRATKNLGHYAANKATAISCRLEGKIESALLYESICDRIYQNLPEWARW